MSHLQEILKRIKNMTPEEEAVVTKAYEIAQEYHKEQKRHNGDPYFLHLTETAKILAEFGAGGVTIAAGLLHDSIEDTEMTAKKLEEEFSSEIAFLVTGVTKLGKLKYHGLERHVESLRKFFIATSKDVRVLIIKLADKLHNLRTLEFVPKEKQKRIALEALEIYAPLANRLGMWRVKGELEDLAFPYLYPKEFSDTKELLKQKKKMNEAYVEKVYRSLRKELAKHKNITVSTLNYRAKYLYSLYKKLVRKEMDIEKVYDIVALRVVVETVEECYQVLGVIHNMWPPLPGRIKDYIALPKPNGYQSIHTTIFTGDGGIVEIQIRTEEMHHEAEYGLAAHLAYKEQSGSKKSKTDARYEWLEQLQALQKNIAKPSAFLKNLKMDFFTDRVFVFTPQGDVIDLPDGSSAIDFAYAVHSQVGNHAEGAKINGKLSALKTKLNNNDIVEIQKNKKTKPSSKWLDYAKTTMAKKHIRGYLQKHGNAFSRYWYKDN